MKGDTRSSRRRLPPLLHWNCDGLKLAGVVLKLCAAPTVQLHNF